MVREEDVIKFLREHSGEATLEEISLGLGIPKYGPNSAYAILYALKSKNIVERRGSRWAIIEHGALMAGPSMEEQLKTAETIELVRETIEGQMTSILEEEPKTEGKSEIERLRETIPSKMEEAYETLKTLSGLQTRTILDDLFLKFNGEPLGGIPASAQLIIAGPLGAGKSLLASEIALKSASLGHKVLYAILDDVWSLQGQAFDLQSRMRIRAESLNLSWSEIRENLNVLNPRVIDEQFTDEYKHALDKGGISIAIIDSVNHLLSSIGDKTLSDMVWANRAHGTIGVFVMHSSAEHAIESSFAQIVDCIIYMAPASIKVTGLGINVETFGLRGVGYLRLLRVLSCRLCSFDGRFLLISIGRNGLIKQINIE
ncbi:MAG: ATPase domain-containing protein [Candidatus Bathyarchaeia archaeon]